jgi:glycosyltransferase involved in cell wall biosynthesis
MRVQYEKSVGNLGLASKVVFAGNVSDVDLPKKYQAADCLVLPSVNKGEAFGIVLLDAMASGLPVIASDLPGVRSVFTAASGLKVKPGDAEDLKNKIKFLMENPEECKIMGVNARKEVRERYGQDMVKEKLISVITNIK